jgi:hypothetical protein
MMILSAVLTAAFLLPGRTSYAQQAGSDKDWEICQDADDPTECADHAREVAKQHVGHGESMLGYARGCLWWIDKAAAQKEKDAASAKLAIDSHSKARDSMKPFCPGGFRAGAIGTSKGSDYDQRVDPNGVIWWCPKNAVPQPPSEEELEAAQNVSMAKTMAAQADADLAQIRKFKREADAIYNLSMKKKVGEMKKTQDELDRAEPDPGMENFPAFNGSMRDSILSLQKGDFSLDKDLRKIVTDQRAADPSNNCDPALKDPFY